MLAFVLPIALHAHLVSDDLLYVRFDSGRVNLPRFELLARSLHEGAFPAWQTLLQGGTPFHANPENPTLYPPVLLSLLAFSPLYASNLITVLHLGLAGLGAYVYVLRLVRREGDGAPGAGAALLAALLFALCHYVRLDHVNLVIYGAAHALVPWIFLAADELLFGARPRRAAGLLALALALQAFTGGLYVFAYTALALVLLLVLRGLAASADARRRTLTWGALALGLAALCIAAKALPAFEWLATTNRAGPVDHAIAHGPTLGGRSDFAWSEVARRVALEAGGWIPVALGATALAAWRSGAARFALALALAGALVALGPLHEPLYALVPPFDRIRAGAMRGWTLTAFWLPVCAGLGAARLASLAARRLGRAWLAVALPAAGALLLVPRLLDSGWIDPILARPDSRRALLAEAADWRAAAERAGAAVRVLDLRRDVIDAWCEQLYTTALDVETVNGFLGHAWRPELERHAFGELEPERRERRLGVLSVGVTVDERGARANPYARPRAFVPEVVVGIVGAPDGDALYALLDDPRLDPRRASVVVFADGEPTAEERRALDLVHDVARDGAPVAALERLPRGPSGARGDARFERAGSSRSRVALAAAGAPRFVVVSEPWSREAGWELTVGGRPAHARHADGVASAVLVPAGAAQLDARYRAPGLRLGLVLGALGVVLAVLLAAAPARR